MIKAFLKIILIVLVVQAWSCTQSKQEGAELVYHTLLSNPDTVLCSEFLLATCSDEQIAAFGWMDGGNLKHLDSLSYPMVFNLIRYKKLSSALRPVDRSILQYDFALVQNGDLTSLQQFVLYHEGDYNRMTRKELKWISQYLVSVDFISLKDLYLQTRLALLLSDEYYTINYTTRSFAVLMYCLHRLDQLDPELNYTHTRDLILRDLLIKILRLSEAADYEESINKLYSSYSQEGSSRYEGKLLLYYLADNIDRYSSTFDKEHLLHTLLEKSPSTRDRLTILWNLAVQKEIAEDFSFLDYYESALACFQEDCSITYYEILLYIISANISLEDRAHYLQVFMNHQDCDEYVRERITFLSPLYLVPEALSSDEKVVVEKILVGRTVAHALYPGQSTLHLQDYYASNYVSLFEAITSFKKIEGHYASLVVNTCYDTRIRDVYRQVVQSGVDGEETNTINRINEILVDLDNFYDYFPEKKAAYKELFELYLSQDIGSEPYVGDSINFKALSAKLKREDKVLVNIHKGSNDYLVYVMDGGGLKQFALPSSKIDSLAEINYRLLAAKSDGEFVNLPLEQMIKVDEERDVVLIPDGVFSNLPPKYFFSGKEVSSYTNVKEYLSSEVVVLGGAPLQIYSYSDERSLANRNVKDYPELPESIRETNGIANVLKDYNVVVSMGMDELHFSSHDLIHLSTHAYSNTTNRLDNFFLVRDASKVKKVYGFNIYQEQHLPKVVVLSACQSGWGVHAYGAGVQTLSRAFLDNGTKTVIKTLWKVNEKATAEFMIEMYRAWVTGLSLYDALAHTQELFKAHPTYSHPYYWAGFVLEGNPNVYLQSDSVK